MTKKPEIKTNIRGFVVAKSPKTGLFAIVDCTRKFYRRLADEFETVEEAVEVATELSTRQARQNRTSLRF